MKKIAIPVSNELLDRHFGHCQEFSVYNVENDRIVSVEKHVPPPHEPGLLPRWLHDMGVSDVIAGGIGQRAIDLFKGNEINVFVGAPAMPATEIVDAFLKGELELSANYCDH